MPHLPGHVPEFTPEINQGFLRRLVDPIKRRGELRRGRVRSEILSRGLTGDPTEFSAAAASDRQTGQELADVESRFAFRGAGLAREERLIGERRQFKTGERESEQEFESQEIQKSREFRERMKRLGFDLEDLADRTKRRRDFQGGLRDTAIKSAFSLGKLGAGGLFG